MLTGTLKSKINRIWDTLFTAGITAPPTVMEQVTYLIFMKLLDDSEIIKESNASIFGMQYQSDVFKNGDYYPDENSNQSIPYKNLRWSIFKNFQPTEMFITVRDFVFPFIKNVNGDDKETAFSRYMQDAVFLIPNAQVLALCVDELDTIDMTNKDIMGDIYEEFLGKMASSGNNGQFRTPRHIIRMMVELVKPQVDDSILDPAMGSAGFLLGCANYLQENYPTELLNEEVSRRYASEMFSGYDTDPTMLRIGAMNLLLHGVEEPLINRADALSEDNQIRDRYTLIMANPPFAGSLFEENISKDLLAVAKTKKTELLFLSLFMRSLKTGGRCASIVPDGVLFGSSKAHKTIRKELIENNKLLAVISMPSGVFKPYAGVSTAVLVFVKDPSGTDDVWFYDMKADGFSLDDKRSEIQENDIPDIVQRYNDLEQEKDRKRTDQSFFVSKQEIVENDYDLSINKYKETVYEKVEYPSSEEIMKKLFELDKQVSKELLELNELLKKSN